jgi:hypothetical protein
MFDMKTSAIQDRRVEQIARIGKATASPGRLELLDLLSQGHAQSKHSPARPARASRTPRITSRYCAALDLSKQKAGVYVTYRLADVKWRILSCSSGRSRMRASPSWSA